jgi:H+/Cl- antiporter ClcA
MKPVAEFLKKIVPYSDWLISVILFGVVTGILYGTYTEYQHRFGQDAAKSYAIRNAIISVMPFISLLVSVILLRTNHKKLFRIANHLHWGFFLIEPIIQPLKKLI